MAVVLVSRNPMLALALEETSFEVVEVAPSRLGWWLDSAAAGHEDALVLDVGSSRAAIDAVERLRRDGCSLPVLVVVSNPDQDPDLLSLWRTGVTGPPVTAARVGAALDALLAGAAHEDAVPAVPAADLPAGTPVDVVADDVSHAADPIAAVDPIDAASPQPLEHLLDPVPDPADDDTDPVDTDPVDTVPGKPHEHLLDPVPDLADDDAPAWFVDDAPSLVAADAPPPAVAVPALAAVQHDDAPAGEDVAAPPVDAPASDGPDSDATDSDTTGSDGEPTPADDPEPEDPTGVVVDLRAVPRPRHQPGPMTSVVPQDDLRQQLLDSRPASSSPVPVAAEAVASVTHMQSRRRPDRAAHRAAALDPTSAPSGRAGSLPSAASVVDAMSRVEGELFGVVETSEAIVADAAERTSSSAAALLVPDGPVWRVAAGEGLRPLETRYQLQPDDWLVQRVADAGKGVIVERSDIARHALRGAPLASRTHLMAVPLQLPETPDAILLVARDGEPPFAEADLVEIAALAREAAPLLTEALRVREVARALARYQDLD